MSKKSTKMDTDWDSEPVTLPSSFRRIDETLVLGPSSEPQYNLRTQQRAHPINIDLISYKSH